jgi:3-oxoadipate enol-lactonase
MQSHYFKTKTGKIYYEVSGAGPTLLLIRGLGRWSEHWLGWQESLSKSFQVIVFDGRGLGRSTGSLMPWNTMSDLTSDLAAILKAERIASAHLVGVSLGGMMALQFGLDYPDLTTSVTAINASIGRSGHMRLTLPALGLLASAPVRKLAIYPELADLLTSPKASSESKKKIFERWLEIDKKYPQPKNIIGSQLIIGAKWRRWESLSQIQAPVHIIVGNDDQFVPRGNSLFIAEKIPHAKLTEIEDAGHEIHVEQPSQLEHAVVGFIAESVT